MIEAHPNRSKEGKKNKLPIAKFGLFDIDNIVACLWKKATGLTMNVALRCHVTPSVFIIGNLSDEALGIVCVQQTLFGCLLVRLLDSS